MTVNKQKLCKQLTEVTKHVQITKSESDFKNILSISESGRETKRELEGEVDGGQKKKRKEKRREEKNKEETGSEERIERGKCVGLSLFLLAGEKIGFIAGV